MIALVVSRGLKLLDRLKSEFIYRNVRQKSTNNASSTSGVLGWSESISNSVVAVVLGYPWGLMLISDPENWTIQGLTLYGSFITRSLNDGYPTLLPTGLLKLC